METSARADAEGPLRLRRESPIGTTPEHDDPDVRDKALLAAHRAGDPEALESLLTSYQNRLFGVCQRMLTDRELARDLAQEAMVKIIQGLDRFDGRSKLSTWMIRVTMNACLSELRRLRLRRHASLDAFTDAGASGTGSGSFPGVRSPTGVEQGEPGVEERVQDSEDRADVSSALARITPEQRAILILRDMQGLDYKAIGELLDIPSGTVKSRIFRARVALRERMDALRAARAGTRG